MANGTVGTSPRLKARIAGVLYVIIIVLALFAPFPVAPSWLLRGDVSATLGQILASKSIYSLGGVAELIVYACDVGVALIFYELLKPVSKSLALLALFFRLTFVAIASANVLNHFAPLLLMSGAEYLASFNPDQLRALAMTFIRLHTIGFDIALVFFGFHCVVVGYLFFRSIFFPRILGGLLALAGLCSTDGRSRPAQRSSEEPLELINMLGNEIIEVLTSAFPIIRRITLSSTGEYVFDTKDHNGSFFYSWPELTYSPWEWFRAGLVAQRTKAYHTSLDVQRGFLVGITAVQIS